MSDAPPTFSTSSVGPSTESTWPVKLAMVTIVLGALGAVGGVCGIAGSLMSGAMAGMMGGMTPPPGSGPSPAETFEIVARYQGVTIAHALVSIAVGVLLLVAGIKLRKRLKQSRKLIMIWAPLKVVMALAGSAIGYVMQQESAKLMAAAATAANPVAGYMETMQTVMEILMFVWGIAFAVFMVIWFTRDSIAAEVETWS